MGLRFTTRPKVGPFVFNIGKRGVSSVSFRKGRYTRRIWTKNKRDRNSVDLPGPFSYRF